MSLIQNLCFSSLKSGLADTCPGSLNQLHFLIPVSGTHKGVCSVAGADCTFLSPAAVMCHECLPRFASGSLPKPGLGCLLPAVPHVEFLWRTAVPAVSASSMWCQDPRCSSGALLTGRQARFRSEWGVRAGAACWEGVLEGTWICTFWLQSQVSLWFAIKAMGPGWVSRCQLIEPFDRISQNDTMVEVGRNVWKSRVEPSCSKQGQTGRVV